MKAFLLAAGFGERLRPLTDRIPKSLMPVLNVPSICYAVTLIKEAGISEVVCNLHHLHRQIIDFFQEHDNFGLRLTFSIEEKILGTGGGLNNCRSHFQDEPFLYINSDIIADIDLKKLIGTFDASRMSGSLVVGRSARSEGRVTVEDGRIVNLRTLLPVNKKPEYDFLGAAVLAPEIFRFLKDGFSDIVETGFIGLVKNGSLGYCLHEGEWHDIGTPALYRKANMRLLKMGADFINRVSAATGLTPSAISRSASVGRAAVIIRSVIGDNCRVEDGAVAEDSVLLPGAKLEAGETAYRKILAP